ncbi:MAG: DUF4190 domain-containing protein [Pirellulales bacterium]
MSACPACGVPTADGITNCPRCGASLASPANPFAERPVPPYGTVPPGANPYPPPGSYPTTTDDAALRMIAPINVSAWAVAAGYLGLVSPICLGFTGPFAILTGILALREIKRNPQVGGKVRSIVGIVFGALGTLMLIGFLVTMLLRAIGN